MSLPGLPPLPKSLSGFEVAQAQTHNMATLEQQRTGLSSHTRPPATLDTQLAILRREMYGLRQLDLSLLSQLWTLNESIQEFRTILQEQEALSPPSPTPSNSQSESELPSSEDEMSSDRPLPRHHHMQSNAAAAAMMMSQQHQQQQHLGATTPPLSKMSMSATSSGHPQTTTGGNRMRIAPPPPPANRKPYQSRPV